ncbi:peptide-methionine (S)-S-oxide reductase MsrA [Thioalkalivibrio thiocyanodenitrificans]|uniref:peptide-methionine (S)-S-oxide reductase MsrA n=1 Tax=Thioalkalivibrio thiocyanodenitrificans TaxID=243063 RepID=UPI000686768B|nr:peptide-methionine (S)-S-oxide reductase MsrA [Thioalkalivibrio thiocyanodenitrificans]
MKRPSVWIISLLLCLPLTVAGEARELARATFAGGCFWCMEPPYDRLDGVVETISGFSGGHVANPSYEAVVRGGTGHLEVVQVIYDPAVVSYEALLYVYWRNIDPFQAEGQFCDWGPMYRSAIFVHDEEQRRLARVSLEQVKARNLSDRPIATRILDFEAFYPAEEYHQGYYRKNPIRYRYYRWNCGRDQRLEDLWGPEAGGSPG